MTDIAANLGEGFYEELLVQGTKEEIANALESIEIYSLQMCKASVETLTIHQFLENSTSIQVMLEEDVIVLPWLQFTNEEEIYASPIIAHVVDTNAMKSIKELFGPKFASILYQNGPENCDIDLQVRISCTSGYLMHNLIPTSVPIEVVTVTAFTRTNFSIVGKYTDVLDAVSSIVYVAKENESDPIVTRKIQSFILQAERRTIVWDTHIVRVKSNDKSISGQYVLGLHVPNGSMREWSMLQKMDADCKHKILNMNCGLRPPVGTNAILLEKVVAVRVYSITSPVFDHFNIMYENLKIQYHEKSTKVSLTISTEELKQALADFFSATVKISKQVEEKESSVIWIITFSTGSNTIDVDMITVSTSTTLFQANCTTLKNGTENAISKLYSLISLELLHVKYLLGDEKDVATLMALEISFGSLDDVPVPWIVSHSLASIYSSVSLEHPMTRAIHESIGRHMIPPDICIKVIGYDAHTVVPLSAELDRFREIIQNLLLGSIGDGYVVDLKEKKNYSDDKREILEWRIRIATRTRLDLSTCDVSSVDHLAWSINLYRGDYSRLITSSTSDVSFKVSPRVEYMREKIIMSSTAKVFIKKPDESLQCTLYFDNEAEEIRQVREGDTIRMSNLQIKRTHTTCADPCDPLRMQISAKEGKVVMRHSWINQPQQKLNISGNLDILNENLANGFEYLSSGRIGYHMIVVTISCVDQHTAELDVLTTTEIPIQIISSEAIDSLTIHVPYTSLDFNFDQKAHIFGVHVQQESIQNSDNSHHSVNVDVWVEFGELSFVSASAYASVETEWSSIWNARGSVSEVNRMLTNIQYRTIMCKGPISEDHLYIAGEMIPQLPSFTVSPSATLSAMLSSVESRILLRNVFTNHCLEVYLGRSRISKHPSYIVGHLNQPIPLTNLSVKAYFSANTERSDLISAEQHVEIRLTAREGKIECDQGYPYNEQTSYGILAENDIDTLNHRTQHCQYLPPDLPISINETDEIHILGKQVMRNETVNVLRASFSVVTEIPSGVLTLEWKSLNNAYSFVCTIGQYGRLPSLFIRVNPPYQGQQRLYTVEFTADEGIITTTSSLSRAYVNSRNVISNMEREATGPLQLTEKLSNLNQILGKLWFLAPAFPERSYSNVKVKVWPNKYPQNVVHEYLLINYTWDDAVNAVNGVASYMTSSYRIFSAKSGEIISISSAFNLFEGINISSTEEVYDLTLKADHGILVSNHINASISTGTLHLKAALHEMNAILLALYYKSDVEFFGVDEVRASVRKYNNNDLDVKSNQPDESWIAIRVTPPPVKVRADFITPNETDFAEWLGRSITLSAPSIRLSTMNPMESLSKHYILHVYLKANFASFQPKTDDLGPDYDGIHVNTSRLPDLLQLTGTYPRLELALRNSQFMMVPRTHFDARDRWITLKIEACTRVEDDQYESHIELCSEIKTKMKLITSNLVNLVRKDTSIKLQIWSNAPSPLSKFTHVNIMEEFPEVDQTILILEIMLSLGRFEWLEEFQCSDAFELLPENGLFLSGSGEDTKKLIRARSTIRCMNEFMAATHVQCVSHQSDTLVSISLKLKQLAWSTVDISAETFVVKCNDVVEENVMGITAQKLNKAIAIVHGDAILLSSIINIPVSILDDDIFEKHDDTGCLLRMSLVSPLYLMFDEKELVQGLSYEFAEQNSTNLTFVGPRKRLYRALHHIHLITILPDSGGVVHLPTPIQHSNVNVALYKIGDYHNFASSLVSSQHFAFAYEMLERRLSWMRDDGSKLDRHQTITSNGGEVSFTNMKLRGRENTPDLQLHLIVEWCNDSLKYYKAQDSTSAREHNCSEISTEKVSDTSIIVERCSNRKNFNDMLHFVALYFTCKNFDSHEMYDLRLTARTLLENSSKSGHDHVTLSLRVLPDTCLHGEPKPTGEQIPRISMRVEKITMEEDGEFSGFGRVIQVDFDDSSLLHQDFIKSTVYKLIVSVRKGLLSLPDTICCIELRTSHVSSRIVILGALSGLQRVFQSLKYTPPKDLSGEEILDLSFGSGQHSTRIFQTEQLLILIEADNDSPTIKIRRSVNSGVGNESQLIEVCINDPDVLHDKPIKQDASFKASFTISSGSLSFQSKSWMDDVILLSDTSVPDSHDQYRSISLQGSLDALNHLFKRVQYFPALSHEQKCSVETTELNVTVNDLGHGVKSFQPKITSTVHSISHDCMPVAPTIVIDKNNRLIYDDYSEKVVMDGDISISGALDDQVNLNDEIENASRCRLEIKCLYLVTAEVQELHIKTAHKHYSLVLKTGSLGSTALGRTFQLWANLSVPGFPSRIRQGNIRADAVAMRSDEVLGQFGNGYGPGESVESVIRTLYEGCGLEFGLSVIKYTKFYPERVNKWTIYVTETTDSITSFPLPYLAPYSTHQDDENVRVSLRIDKHFSTVSGEFQLRLGEEVSKTIPADPTALELQEALEELETVKMVHVSPRFGKLHWGITFFNYWKPFPILEGIKNDKNGQTMLFPGPRFVEAGGKAMLKFEATIETSRAKSGTGHGSIFEVVVGAHPMSVVYRLSTFATSVLSGSFQIGLFDLHGQELARSSAINYDVEASIPMSERFSGIGRYRQNSLESELSALILGLSKTLGSHDIGIAAHKVVTDHHLRLSNWTITFTNCHHDFPTFKIASTVNLKGNDAGVELHIFNETERLGGTFSLVISTASAKKPHTFHWNVEASTIEEILNDDSLDEFAVKTSPKFHVRRRRHEQNGYAYGILLLSQNIPLSLDSAFRILSVDGTNLTGLGAFARINYVYQTFDNNERELDTEYALSWTKMPHSGSEFAEYQHGVVTYRMDADSVILEAKRPSDLVPILPKDLELQVPKSLNGGFVQFSFTLLTNRRNDEHVSTRKTSTVKLPTLIKSDAFVIRTQATQNEAPFITASDKNFTLAGLHIDARLLWLENAWVNVCISVQKECTGNEFWVNGTTNMINFQLKQIAVPTNVLLEHYNYKVTHSTLLYNGDIVTTLPIQLRRRLSHVNDITVPYPTIRMPNAAQSQILHKREPSERLRAAFDAETNLFSSLAIVDAGCSVILNHVRYATPNPILTQDEAYCDLQIHLRSVYGTINVTETIEDTLKFTKISEQEILIRTSRHVINYILANLLTYRCCRNLEYHQYDLVYVSVRRENSTGTNLVPSQQSDTVLEIDIDPTILVPKVHINSTELSRSTYIVNKTSTYQLVDASVTFYSRNEASLENIKSAQSAALQLYRFEMIQSSTKDYREARIIYEFFSKDATSSTNEVVGHFCELNSSVICTGYDNQHGTELWITDGNPNNTRLFIDMLPGPPSSNPAYLTAMNGKVYFAAEGLDLSWTLDLDSCNGFRSIQANGDDFLYIIGKDSVWKPKQRYECPAGYRWISSREFSEKIILAAEKVSLGVKYPSIYWNYCDWNGYKFGGGYRRYFRFSDSHSNQAYQHAGRAFNSPLGSDGSALDFAGIVCVKFSPEADPTIPALGRELWVTDGSSRGTKRVRDIRSGSTGSNPKYLSLFSSMIVFQATTDEFGTELFRTDGTEAATVMIADIWAGPRSSNPSYLTEWKTGDGRLYFAATSDSGRELWVSSVHQKFHTYYRDDSASFGESSTYMLCDIHQGRNSSNPRSLVAATTKAGISGVFFSADDGVHGRELWVTDGTTSGTKMIIDLASGKLEGSNPAYLTLFQGEIYFQAIVDVAVGVELYKTDGTSSNTRLVKNLVPGSAGSYPRCLSNIKLITLSGDSERLYFVANERNRNEIIWSYDGTSFRSFDRSPIALQIIADPEYSDCKLFGFKNSIISAIKKENSENTGDNDLSFPRDCSLRMTVDKGDLLIPPYDRRQPSNTANFDAGNAQRITQFIKTILYKPPQDWAQSYDGSALSCHWTMEFILNGVNHTIQIPLMIAPVNYIPRLLSTLVEDTILTKEDTNTKIHSISVVMCDPILDDRYIHDCIPFLAKHAFRDIFLELNASLQHSTFRVGYSDCLMSFLGDPHGSNDIYTRLDSGKPWKAITMVGSWACFNEIVLHQWSLNGDRNYAGEDTLNMSIGFAATRMPDRDGYRENGIIDQGTDQKSLMIRIEQVNDAPYLIASQHYECDEGVPFIFTDLTVVDSDGEGALVQIDIEAELGNFFITREQPNVTILSHLDSTDLRIIGKVCDINNALKKMVYVSKPDWNSLELTANANSLGLATTFDHVCFRLHDFESLNDSTARTVEMFIRPVQDAVAITAPDIKSNTTERGRFYEVDEVEDLTTMMRDVEFNNVEWTTTITIQVELNVDRGILAMLDSTLNDVSFYDGTANNERYIHFGGSLHAVNMAIQTLAYLPDTAHFEHRDVLVLKIQSYDTLTMQFSPTSYLRVPLLTTRKHSTLKWKLPKSDIIAGSLAVWYFEENNLVRIQNTSFTDEDDEGIGCSGSRCSREMELTFGADNGYFHLSRLQYVESSVKILISRRNENKEWRFLLLAAPMNILNYVLGEIEFHLGQDRDVSRALDVRLKLTINENGSHGTKGNSTQLHFIPRNSPKKSKLSVRSIDHVQETKEDHVLYFNRSSTVLVSVEDEGCCSEWLVQLKITCEHGEFLVPHSPGVSTSRKDERTVYMEGYVQYIQTVLRNGVYNPDEDWNGADRLYFTISDGRRGSELYASISISVLPICDEPRFTHARDSRTEYVMTEDTEIPLHLPLIIDPDAKESTTRDILLTIDVMNQAGYVMPTQIPDPFLGPASMKNLQEAWLRSISIRGNVDDLNAVLGGLMYRPRANSYNSLPGVGLIRPMDEIQLSLVARNEDRAVCDDTDESFRRLSAFIQVDAVSEPPVLVSEVFTRLPSHLGIDMTMNELDDSEFCKFLASMPSAASAIEDQAQKLMSFTIYDADISEFGPESNRILLNITGFGVRVYRDSSKQDRDCSVTAVTVLPQRSDTDLWLAMVGPQIALNCMTTSQLMFVGAPDYYGIAYIIVQISDLSFSGGAQEEPSTYVLRVDIEAADDIPTLSFPSYGTKLAPFVVEFGKEILLTGAPLLSHLSRNCERMANPGICTSKTASKALISQTLSKWSLVRIRPMATNSTDRIAHIKFFHTPKDSAEQFSMAALGLHFVFGGIDSVHGAGLWQSKGNSLETRLLKKFAPGKQSSNPSYLTHYSEHNLVLFAAEGFDTSWRMKEDIRDHCDGMRRSTFNPRIVYVVAHNDRMKKQQEYDCPAGYSWMSTEQASMHLSNTGLVADSRLETLTYFDQCGWDGYEWRGTSRRLFLFSDSKFTGAYKDARSLDAALPDTGNPADPFAGLVCWENSGHIETTGIELWAADGSEEGTRRVHDINPGPLNSSPSGLYEFEGAIFFQATTGSFGAELWTTQGTSESTLLLVDIESGPRSSYPRYMTGMHSKLFFSAKTHATGREPWNTLSITTLRLMREDHNQMGAGILCDICAGPGSSNPREFVVLKENRLLFQADDCVHGPELWISDGTGMGTYLLADIFPGSEGSNPSYLTALGTDRIYFQANDGVHGPELWVTDGTSDGTRMLIDLEPGYIGSYPTLFVPFKSSQHSMLLFLTKAVDQMQQLWQTDGSESGTSRVWQHTQQLLPIDIPISEVNSRTQIIALNDANDLYLFGKEKQEMNAELKKVEDARTYRPPLIDDQRSLTLWDVDSCQNSSIEYRLRLQSSEGELSLMKNSDCKLLRVIKGDTIPATVKGGQVELEGVLESLNCVSTRIAYRTASKTAAANLISATLVKLDDQRECPQAQSDIYAHVLAFNTPPEIIAEEQYEVKMNEWNLLMDIRIKDTDSEEQYIYVRVSIRYGRLWFHSHYLQNRRTSLVTIFNIIEWDQSKQSIELSGSLININKFLATMRYGCFLREGCAATLNDTLHVVVNDNGSGRPQAARTNISLVLLHT
uniref:Uncharacterized protein putative n=1 Tax=Albugo laibachii Nc14 TaxID=890382 RepID=F0WTQ5_9STRA|nr:uncharacterized protein putative [Albugo laibachii Nc14]|eukprot:CCA24747.1 uncharacterized protein putative [Albugo laibachii Nc14]